MTTITTGDVQDFIRDADDYTVGVLDTLLRERRKQLRTNKAAEGLASLKIGDHVSLSGLSPKYMNGATAVIVRRDGTKFQVRFDEGTDWEVTNRFGPTVRVPASCLTKIND